MAKVARLMLCLTQPACSSAGDWTLKMQQTTEYSLPDIRMCSQMGSNIDQHDSMSASPSRRIY